VDARLAWSRRAKFRESYVIEPVFDLPYQQLDGRVSYDFRGPFGGAFEVFAQGTNLLNQKVRKVGRYDDQFVLYNDIGPRYAVGFRLDL
jgi:iron complex outermembrane receptor protein